MIDIESEELESHEEVGPSKLAKLYVFFLLMFQSTFRLSDTALTVLLSFLSTFLMLLAKHYELEGLISFCTELPQSTVAARKVIGDDRNNFKKYACCPTCFDISIWCDGKDGKKVDNVSCANKKYPNHPQPQHRKPCGQKLLKVIKTPSQSLLYYPRLLYCYKPIIQSLQELILRPTFISQCELWRNRKVTDGVLRDVYDGQVWRDFQEYDGKAFLSAPFNYALCLNVDWFQPYDHTKHSEGAAYITVLNLPRKQRYLQENIILLGIIPGPKEPPLNLNSFLHPFVDELLKLWQGVVMTCEGGAKVLVRAALLCCACDIPAARKVCGFVGHGALKGCSKCLLNFPTDKFGEKQDYTNTDRSQWIARTKNDHKVQANRHKSATTRSQQKKTLRENMDVDIPFSMSYHTLIPLACASLIPCIICSWEQQSTWLNFGSL